VTMDVPPDVCWQKKTGTRGALVAPLVPVVAWLGWPLEGDLIEILSRCGCRLGSLKCTSLGCCVVRAVRGPGVPVAGCGVKHLQLARSHVQRDALLPCLPDVVAGSERALDVDGGAHV